MLQTWQITSKQNIRLNPSDSSSLDAITRQLPDGYYSTFRTYDKRTRVLGLTSHLRRLYGPVLKPDVNTSELRRNLIRLLEPFRPDEARVRVMMTKQGQVYVAIETFSSLPREVYENGVRVETTELQRESPRLKSTTFISTSGLERNHIAQTGIFEALLVKDGKILEGMTSNFFYLKSLRAPEEHRDYSERSDKRLSRSADEARGFLQPHASSTGLTSINPSAHIVPKPFREREILYTAQRDVLLGVTRGTVIRLARGRGVAVKYQPLKLNQLSDVNEAFITSSSRGIVPVVQINEVAMGQGSPGEITRMLMSAYDEYVSKHAEKI